MDFNPTETQTLLASTVQALTEREYSLKTRQSLQAQPCTQLHLWPRLAELGVLGVEIDESYGGSGGTFEDLAAILPVFGRALLMEPFMSTLVIGVGLVAQYGTQAQRARLLPSIAEGTQHLAFAHAERQARDMASWVTATARRNAQGWLLDGAKSVVLGGDLAATLIVSARTSGAPADPAGISLFLVSRDSPCLQRRDYKLYDGSGAADLVFTAMPVPEDALFGTEGCGLAAVEFAHERARAALCAEAIGVMDRLRDITLEYLRTRNQFGQPIGKFQALQHRMVDAHIEIELARSMALLAVTAVADTDPARRGRSISAAKARVGRAARIVGQSAVQLHGGIALTEDYSAGHYFKRLTMIERLFGDVHASVMRFAAA